MQITAPNSQFINEFNQNFKTYVAFMQAFRAVWESFLDPQSPVSVGEGGRDFSNYAGSGSSAPQNTTELEVDRYNVFLPAIEAIVEDARARGWILPI